MRKEDVDQIATGSLSKGNIDNKKKLLFERQRQDYICDLKDKVADNIIGGHYLDAYSEFSKLCRFNVVTDKPIYFHDPLEHDREPEYIPSMVEHVGSFSRMSLGVAAGEHTTTPPI